MQVQYSRLTSSARAPQSLAIIVTRQNKNAFTLPGATKTKPFAVRRSSEAANQAFAAHDLASVDLHFLPPAHGTGNADVLYSALDRLLALARAAPGAVAVHCGAGRDWPAWSLDTLAAAFLIRRFGFSGAEAAAWVRMVAS